MATATAWMPLYVGDYLADTMHLSGAQHGAYLLLLMHQWRTGPLPNNEATLAAIARTDINVWRKTIWPVLQPFFEVLETGLSQKRLAAERERATNKTHRRAEAGRKGAANRWQGDGKAIAMPSGCHRQTDGESESQSHTPLKPPSSLKPKPLLAAVDATAFAVWWRAYPRRIAKDRALSAYAAALRKGATTEILLATLQRAKFDDREDGRFIPHPATWLNDGRWQDELTSGSKSAPECDTRYFDRPIDDVLALPEPRHGSIEHHAWIRARDGFTTALPGRSNGAVSL